MTAATVPTFVSNAPPTGPLIVGNLPHYPELDGAVLRAAYRVRPDVSDDALVTVLTEAAQAVNTALAAWWAGQQAEDNPPATLYDVRPAEQIGGQPAAVAAYVHACYCHAKARLSDARRDTDTTGAGHARADAIESTADVWLAQSHRSVRAVQGLPGGSVELL